MSAPTTPAEMADWLEQTFGDELWPSDEDAFGAVIAYLRSVPTDAQKIEALQAERLAVMCRMGGALADEFHHHREALRLLGLSTE